MPARTKANAYADRAAARSLGLLHSTEILTKLRKRANSSFDTEAAEIKILEDLLPYQRAFVQDFQHKYVGFCGGYGCVAGETLINGTPIKELTEATIQVQTIGGTAEASPAYRKGVASLFRVTTANGCSIIVTKEHKFLTLLGWRKLGDIYKETPIAVRRNGAEERLNMPSPWAIFVGNRIRELGIQGDTDAFLSSREYGWSNIAAIEYVRDDDFYDLHVPLWNHYEAHGILNHNSGKTYSLVMKQLLLCFRSQGFTHLFLEPTIPLIDDVALPKWNEVLDKYAIPHTFKASPRPSFKLLLPGGETPVLLRSMENYERLIGVNAASIATDETDTTRAEVAEKAMIKLPRRKPITATMERIVPATRTGTRPAPHALADVRTDGEPARFSDTEPEPERDPGAEG